MTDVPHPKPGDLLEYRCPTFGIVWQWRVQEVNIAARSTDSFVEVLSVHGGTTPFRIPEPMTRGLHIFRMEENRHD